MELLPTQDCEAGYDPVVSWDKHGRNMHLACFVLSVFVISFLYFAI